MTLPLFMSFCWAMRYCNFLTFRSECSDEGGRERGLKDLKPAGNGPA